MSLSSATQKLLNLFSETQVALQNRSQPYATANIGLGDALQNLNSETVDECTYSFTVSGGAVGSIPLALTLPAGAIIKQVTTDETTTLASGGSATIAIGNGTDTIVTAAALSSWHGTQNHLAAPVKTTVAHALTMTVAVSALTAGKLRICVAYIKPTSTKVF
jgi:hypothetical protein